MTYAGLYKENHGSLGSHVGWDADGNFPGEGGSLGIGDYRVLVPGIMLQVDVIGPEHVQPSSLS